MMTKTKVIFKLGQATVGKQNIKVRRIPHNMSNMRMHWAEKNRWKKAWQEEVGWSFMENRNKLGKLPLKKPKIVFKLFMITPYDIDGAYNAIKPLLDELKVWKDGKKTIPGLGVIVDDSPKDIDLQVKPLKINKRDDEHVEIEISF